MRLQHRCFLWILQNFWERRFWRTSVSGCLKADLHSANFNRVNDTFRWRRLSFQSLFEENEIWIICKATCSVGSWKNIPQKIVPWKIAPKKIGPQNTASPMNFFVIFFLSLSFIFAHDLVSNFTDGLSGHNLSKQFMFPWMWSRRFTMKLKIELVPSKLSNVTTIKTITTIYF